MSKRIFALVDQDLNTEVEAMLSRYGNKNISTDSLEKRLKEALATREEAEVKFRVKHVNKWTIMFCDVSRNLKTATDIDEDQINTLTAEYRALVTDIIDKYDPPYIASGDGPQLVICFDGPHHAADAAIEIQSALKRWRYRDDGGQYFRPSIGLHSGDFVIKDDDLKQSNACNLGKRIETQAHSGQVFISSTTREELAAYPNYEIEFVREAMLKNIPEIQQVYALSWQMSHTLQDAKEQGHAGTQNSDHSPKKDKEEEKVIEDYLGILICDVAGSTKKFWNLGDREGNLLIDIFRKEVFLILKKYKAIHTEIREGDMIVACFSLDRPILNVMAAVEIQKNFFRRNVSLGQRTREKIESSIGLHVGHMTIRNDEIVPTQDFFACKGIQDLAEANEICITQEIANMVSEYSNLPLVEAGETNIKGFEEPIKIYSLEWFKSHR